METKCKNCGHNLRDRGIFTRLADRTQNRILLWLFSPIYPELHYDKNEYYPDWAVRGTIQCTLCDCTKPEISVPTHSPTLKSGVSLGGL